MPIPTHGPFCQTLVYETNCWYCQEGIWVLQCTCGSAVLFEECGPPWTKHGCAASGAGGIGGSGYSGWSAVSKLMELGVPISSDVRNKIFPHRQQPGHNATRETKNKRVTPRDGKQHSLLAVVRELYSRTKRIAVVNDLSVLGLRLLGLDPVARYRQITLVVNGERPNKSFTALVPDQFVRQHGLKRGVMVTAEMFGSVRGEFSNWIITSIDPV